MPPTRASLLLAVVLVASACREEPDTSTPSPTAANPSKLVISAILSTTGPASAIGLEAQRGAKVAEQQINALGGVLGRQLELRVSDDESNPTKTKELADRLMGEGVTLGIGPTTSSSAVALKDLLLQRKMLLVSPSATSPVLDRLSAIGQDAGVATPPVQGEPVLFRTAATDAFQAAALAQFASVPVAGTRRCPSIAIVYQKDDYGTPIASYLDRFYRGLSLLVKGPFELESFTERREKYDDAARQVGEANTACQVVIAQPQVAAEYMRAHRRYITANPSQRWATFLTVGSDGLRQNSFVVDGRNDPSDPNAPTAGEGSFAVAADTAPEGPGNAAFKNLFAARYPGIDPGRYSSTAYDAVMVLALSMIQAKTSSDLKKIAETVPLIVSGGRAVGPDRLAEAVSMATQGGDLDYEGASGSLELVRESGSVRADFGVWQIKQGAFQLVQTFSASVLSGL